MIKCEHKNIIIPDVKEFLEKESLQELQPIFEKYLLDQETDICYTILDNKELKLFRELCREDKKLYDNCIWKIKEGFELRRKNIVDYIHQNIKILKGKHDSSLPMGFICKDDSGLQLGINDRKDPISEHFRGRGDEVIHYVEGFNAYYYCSKKYFWCYSRLTKFPYSNKEHQFVVDNCERIYFSAL